MKIARVLSCTPNPPATERKHNRTLAYGRPDLGPTFNAMRAKQDERRRQQSFWNSMAANSTNHMGSANSALAQQSHNQGLQGAMLVSLGGIACNGYDGPRGIDDRLAPGRIRW